MAADYLVVRLRENGLPTLGIMDSGYLELQVYPVAPRPKSTMAAIAQWVESRAQKNQNASDSH